MERYLNKSGNSPITYYQIEESNITVWFKGASRTYTYSHRKAGSYHVENMKRLAVTGVGLSTYITRNVKYLYD
jgi:hypothetical protein